MNHVEEILKRSIEIHLKKRADYATDPTANPFENFDRSNEVARWFPDSYKSFAILIGTKLARLGSLLVTGKVPSNESIEDTFLDLVTYCALFYAFWKSGQVKVQEYLPKPPVKPYFEACSMHDHYDIICKECRRMNHLSPL